MSPENKDFPKIVFITNIPSPYRVTLFDFLGNVFREKFSVIYCSESISNLPWETIGLKHVNYKLRNIRVNLLFKTFVFHIGILKNLQVIKPDIIVTGGIKMQMLIAIVYAKFYKKKHIVTTDAWELTEKGYSFLHILIRRIIYKHADAFLPVGIKGKNNFLRYGVDQKKIFIVPYTIDESKYYSKNGIKNYDIMFCGQLIERKMPLFFCEVAKGLNLMYRNIRVLILGKGPLENEIRSYFEKEGIQYSMPGFVQQNDIAQYFQNSKVFLFPTLSDGWGVVANEACASGLPVITCANAGVADDLIINGNNGFVLPLLVESWVEHVSKLLSDIVLYETFSKNSLEQVRKYSVENAANRVKNVINFLLKNEEA